MKLMKYSTLIDEQEDPLVSGHSLRPGYFLLIKYTLISYLILHFIWISATFPSGLADFQSTNNHSHTSQIHTLWIISIIYSLFVTCLGLSAIFKEHFLLCITFSSAMALNVILLVYTASLHDQNTCPLVVSLLTSWFFTSLAITFTKLVVDTPGKYSPAFNGIIVTSSSTQSSGFFHKLYAKRSNNNNYEQDLI